MNWEELVLTVKFLINKSAYHNQEFDCIVRDSALIFESLKGVIVFLKLLPNFIKFFKDLNCNDRFRVDRLQFLSFLNTDSLFAHTTKFSDESFSFFFHNILAGLVTFFIFFLTFLYLRSGFFLAGTDRQQIQELLVLLKVGHFLLILVFFIRKLGKLLCKRINFILELLTVFHHISNLLFSFFTSVLEFHFVFFVFVLILFESFLAIIQLFLFHNDVFFEQLGLFCLVWYGNLGHQDLARIQNEVTSWLFLLSWLALIFNWFQFDWIVALSWQLWETVISRYDWLIMANSCQGFVFQHSWILYIKDVQLLLVNSCVSFIVFLYSSLTFLFIFSTSWKSNRRHDFL